MQQSHHLPHNNPHKNYTNNAQQKNADTQTTNNNYLRTNRNAHMAASPHKSLILEIISCSASLNIKDAELFCAIIVRTLPLRDEQKETLPGKVERAKSPPTILVQLLRSSYM